MTRHDPEILSYQTDDGTTRVEVRMAGETVWLIQNQMADLFMTTKQNVGQHKDWTWRISSRGCNNAGSGLITP